MGIMKYKLLLTLALALLVSVSTYAQRKPNINKAKTELLAGNLAEAKTIIDEAILHEKTMDDGKTWYYRGLIYASIDTTSNADYQALSEDPLNEALMAFEKANEIDPEQSGYYIISGSAIPETFDNQLAKYYNFYFQNAVADYEADQLQEATDNFLLASRILVDDTTAISYAGYMASANGSIEEANGYFQQAIDKGAMDQNLYISIINGHLSSGNQDEALAAIKAAQEVFPTNTELKRQEITILINQGKSEQAMNELNSAIAAEPNDPALYFALALIHEELDDKSSALEAYSNALEVAPDHYESAFNKAVLIFNEANELYKEQAALGITREDQVRSAELAPKIKEGFEAALPAWEQVYEIKKPVEGSTLESLYFLYSFLRMNDKAEMIGEELDALEAE